jgi:hypothetical protein
MVYKRILMNILAILPILLNAQAKRPTLMVIPADSWCQSQGFMMTVNGKLIPDYDKAWQNSQDLLGVVSKIGELMADRGFPLKDMSQSLKDISKARADILMEVGWKVNQMGPKRSVSYTLRGIDAYTHKQVAAGSGTGKMSFSTELPVLLEEAVLEKMDNFTDQLQMHFEDLLANGREVTIDVKTTGAIGLNKEYDGKELSDIIEEWMAVNTVEHRYSLSDASENLMSFEQVRIPLYADNGMAMDSRRFVMGLRKVLTDMGIASKIETSGLGKATIIIGTK